LFRKKGVPAIHQPVIFGAKALPLLATKQAMDCRE
jgi:hypothetical protein